jgi:hypothetical protein
MEPPSFENVWRMAPEIAFIPDDVILFDFIDKVFKRFLLLMASPIEVHS